MVFVMREIVEDYPRVKQVGWRDAKRIGVVVLGVGSKPSLGVESEC